MQKIKVGFDLGNNSLKIAVLRGEAVECHEYPLPENLIQEDQMTMPHAFSAFLKKIKKELHLPTGPAGLILPGSQVICRMVTMPRMTEEQLMLNLPYEFSDFIQGEAHLYYCDYALCQPPDHAAEPEEEPMLTMMAAAVKKQQVQEYAQVFSAGGFSLRLMLPEEMALIQLVNAHRQTADNAPREFCFVDLGYLSTRIVILHDDRVQATRRIPIGGRDLSAAAVDILNVDPYLADSYLQADHQGILSHERCMEIYEQIAVEALKLINFYHFSNRGSQLSGMYLIGGGAGIEPLRRILEDTLELRVLSSQELIRESAGSVPVERCIGAVGLIADWKED